jgi:GMP synthase (glutamine-hydrolysing)
MILHGSILLNPSKGYSVTDSLRSGGIAILDFGSQYTQLIARRVREQGVYAEVFPHDADWSTINQHSPKGLILSGGPGSIYETNAPKLADDVKVTAFPTLGVCYGMQLMAHNLGGKVIPGKTHEYGRGRAIQTEESKHSPLFKTLTPALDVWMSHGDHVEIPPDGFKTLATSDNGLLAAIGDDARRLYAVQFHPEVSHTHQGIEILRNFVYDICQCEESWSPALFIEDAIGRIRDQVGEARVLLGLSGGVDSAVAAALLHEAIGDQLTCVFVNTGMLRKNEADEVVRTFQVEQKMNLIAVDATERFLDALQGVTEPEAKRKIIGKQFIDVFAEEARKLSAVGNQLFVAPSKTALGSSLHLPPNVSGCGWRPRHPGQFSWPVLPNACAIFLDAPHSLHFTQRFSVCNEAPAS